LIVDFVFPPKMSKRGDNRLQSFWPKETSTISALPPRDSGRLAAKVEPLIENVGQAIATYPRTSLLVVASLGVFLGWFTKRK
jgi:hypothetical protein